MVRELPLEKPLVVAKNLVKTFGGNHAVNDINFEVYPGEIVGFLGPNGAGKTTTIRMLLNILNPTSGELTLFGFGYKRNRNEILRKMNSSSGSLSLPGKLSVKEALVIFSDLYGIQQAKSRVDELLQKFDLTKLIHKPIYALSTGQQVRVSFAKSFLNYPKILLLDEPTSSLDPDVADRLRRLLVRAVKEEQTTVFLTSHNMTEVEKICTRVLFINKGKIQAEGTPKDLATKAHKWKLNLKFKDKLNPMIFKESPPQIDLLFDTDTIKAEMDQNQIGPFITKLVNQGAKIDDISIKEPTLEDFFLHIARK